VIHVLLGASAVVESVVDIAVCGSVVDVGASAVVVDLNASVVDVSVCNCLHVNELFMFFRLVLYASLVVVVACFSDELVHM
jgi:hypothetical protein